MTHPLREEPTAIVIAVVNRAGLAGLVACALFAGLARLLLCRSFDIHMPRVGAPDLRAESILQRRQ
jgi:hypothetical protein